MCEYIGGPPCGPVWCPGDYLYWEDTALGWGTKAGNNCDVKDLLWLLFRCFWMIPSSQKMIVLAVLRNIWLRLGDYLYWENTHSNVSSQSSYTSTYCSKWMNWEMRHPVNKDPYNVEQWHGWSRFHDQIVHQGPRSALTKAQGPKAQGEKSLCQVGPHCRVIALFPSFS